MALNNIIASRQQVLNSQGVPVAGGSVYLYEPGTTTYITAYQDSGLVTPHTQPIKLSGSGRANIWISRDCDLRIEDRNGNLILEELNANPDALGANEIGGLLPNGSFETDADSDDVPDGWTLADETGSTNAIDTSESTDGGQCFRFTSSGSGGGSLTTTDFFPVNDSDDLRVDFDIRSTVATVRNIVRVEWYDISQVSISNTDVYDSTSNPTSFTSNNLLATPPANARFAKLKLIGIDPSVALSGSTYFDRVEAYYPTIVSGVFDNITIQNNQIITTNTNGDLTLEPNGTGKVVLYNNSLIRLDTAGGGLLYLRSDGNTDTENRLLYFLHQDGTARGYVGHPASTQIALHNLVHGGNVVLSGETTGGAFSTLLNGDPEGSLISYYNNTARLLTNGSGSIEIKSDGNTDAENRYIELAHQDGTTRANVGFSAANSTLIFENIIVSGAVLIRGMDSGSANSTMIECDPDGDVALFYDGTEVARTLPVASGGFQINNTSTGAGWERALSESDMIGISHTVVEKSSDTTRASTTTMTADPHLIITGLAAGNYKFEMYLLVQNTGVATAGIKLGIAWSGALNDYNAFIGIGTNFVSGSEDVQRGVLGGSPTGLDFHVIQSTTVSNLIRISGYFDANSSGNLQLYWAQASSNANGTTLLARSRMEFTLVSY